MGDLKGFIIPAIAALMLHGILISFKLPKHEKLKPILQGNPIRVEINTFSQPTIAHNEETFSPQPTVPEKREESKQAEVPLKEKSPDNVEEEKSVTKPIDIRKKHKKIINKPKTPEKKMVVQNKDKSLDIQNKKNDPHEQSDVPTLPDKIIDNAVVKQKTAVPMYRKNKPPSYPVMARRRGYEGGILLNVLVDAKGIVSEIKIKRSSGHRSLDAAALEAVKTWLFTPASERGKPVAMWIDVPIEFKLKSA